jgi:hypothetical protein
MSIHRGASYIRQITIAGEAQPENVTTHYRIARNAGAETPLVEVDDTDITVEEESTDVLVYSFELTHAATRGLPLGRVYEELYEVENGVRNVLYTGTLIVRPAQIAQHPVSE